MFKKLMFPLVAGMGILLVVLRLSEFNLIGAFWTFIVFGIVATFLRPQLMRTLAMKSCRRIAPKTARR